MSRGFDGAVVSDWGAMSSSVASVRAGLDLCMPGPRPDHARALVEAVRSGDLGEDRVTEAVSHVERLARRVEEARGAMPVGPTFGNSSPESAAEMRESFVSDEEFCRAHADLARTAAAQSAVLLKNDGVLPSEPGCKGRRDPARSPACRGIRARFVAHQPKDHRQHLVSHSSSAVWPPSMPTATIPRRAMRVKDSCSRRDTCRPFGCGGGGCWASRAIRIRGIRPQAHGYAARHA